MLEIGLVLLGGAVGYLGRWVQGLVDRDTHASNRIFEMRMSALTSIWDKYIEALSVLSRHNALGHDDWQKEHLEEACRHLSALKKEIERHQVVLDRKVVDRFVDVCVSMVMFSDGDFQRDDGRPVSYIGFLNKTLQPKLDDLAKAINETIDVSTHAIDARLSRDRLNRG
jgi:hypothetical protein